MQRDIKYAHFKVAVASVLSGYSHLYNEGDKVYFPYSFTYVFRLEPSKIELSRYSSDIAFSFNYMVQVGTLNDVYSLTVCITSKREYKKTFAFNTLDEIMEITREMLNIFKHDIVSRNDAQLDMSIKNFENYCAISGLE